MEASSKILENSIEMDMDGPSDLANANEALATNAIDTAQPKSRCQTPASENESHVGSQQSPMVIDDDLYGQEVELEANDRAPMPPPPARGSNLSLGGSILRTPARSDKDQNLLKIQQAQRNMREKMLAARREREKQSKYGSSSGPASRASSVIADGQYPGVGVDDEETEHQRLAAQWKADKATYDRKSKSGGVSVQEEIKHMRDQRAEETRVRRYNECKRRLAEESERRSESPEPAPDTTEPRPLFVNDDDFGFGDESDDDLQRSVSQKSKGKRKAVPVDLGSDEYGLSALLQKRPKKSNDSSSTTTTDSKRKRKKASTKQKKATDPKGHKIPDVNSLLGSNVIQDAGQNHKLASQPTFTSTRRDAAMKELIATMPVEQRKVHRVDRQYLLTSLKDFLGSRTIKQIPDVGNGESGFLLKGMRSPLKNFQVLGAAFMRRREPSDDQPFGGLVGDQMGLGKTVMMLANIADDLAHRVRGRDSPTLIVATPALVKQWESEIRKHLSLEKLGRSKTGKNTTASIMTYMTGSKMKSDNSEDIIAGHEFVLTTYDEVRRSFPTNKTPPVFQTSQEKAEYWKEFIAKNKGLLHQVDWKRIVLDEAQAIKNRASQTSLACRFLNGKHRWAMSGTPIQNGIGELYPYFRFLKVRASRLWVVNGHRWNLSSMYMFTVS